MDQLVRIGISLVFVSGMLFQAGCKPDSDDIYPVINVLQPYIGQIFSNGDTIKLNAAFSDNEQLVNIQVALMDQDNKPMLATLNPVVSGNPFSFQSDYVIDDPLLPGGIYQLRFQASDGNNITNKFVEIQIMELPRSLLYPLVVTKSANSVMGVWTLENGKTWKNIYSGSGDFEGSAVNSSNSLFYLCGRWQSGMSAFHLPDGELLWQIKANPNPVHRWVEGVNFTWPMFYISYYEGFICGYNPSGNEIYKSETFPTAIPTKSVLTKNFIVGSFIDELSNLKYLVSFHNQGGKLIFSKFITDYVVSMFCPGNDDVVVFANAGGLGKISLYESDENTLLFQHSFDEGIFYGAAEMDTDNYLVSTSTGLFWYRLSNNSLSKFASAKSNTKIVCDNTSMLVFAGSGKTVNVFAFPDGTLLESYDLPDTLIDLHLVFNKN